jgi:opacity protein-like surface antigen
MKNLYLIMILFSIASSTQAQFIRAYGIKLGITSANYNWDYIPSAGFVFDPDNRVGLNVGVFTELLDNPIFSIIAEINYMQKGMKEELEKSSNEFPDGIGEFFTWNMRTDYLNFSAFGKARLNLGIVTPYLIAGPKIDFELNKTFSDGSSGGDPFDNFKKNRIGFKVGIGAEINLMVVNLLAEFLYDADFNELYKNDILKINTNSIDLRIGIIF